MVCGGLLLLFMTPPPSPLRLPSSTLSLLSLSLSLCVPLLSLSPLSSEDSELHQQLSVVTLGQRLKLSVEQVKEDESVSLVCDDLKGATVLATKHHSMGEDSKHPSNP